MTIVLAIETSQRTAGVALRTRAGDVLVEKLSPQKRHDDDLMPAIDRLFRRAGIAPQDLGAVGVSVGPGGFTGLRIAVTTAKMLGEALHAATVAVPSALVAAQSWSDGTEARDGISIIVALAGKNETSWCTRLQRQQNEWLIVGTPGLQDANTIDLAAVHVVLADQYLPAAIRARCESEQVAVIDPVFAPEACLVLAERLLAQGQTVDPLQLKPLYPREPEAVTIWEARKSPRC